MAATNFTPIILYHTTTASAAPTAGNLNNGELAINITDGKLFYKDNGGTVQVIATKGTGTIGGSNTQVQYNSSGALAGSANFTFNGTTATINTLNLTNALGTAYGGTALTTYTQGDLVYASAANTLAKLGIGANTYILTSTGSVPQWSAPSAVTVSTANNLAGGAAGSVPYQSGASTTTFLSIGSAGQVLTSSGSAPQWSNLSSLGVTSLSFGTTGLTPSTATQGAITVAGTLATTNGGTGLTSFSANQVFYASSTSAVAQSVNLQFSGTDLTVYGITVGRGAGAVSTNTAVGASAAAANTTGSYSTYVGWGSGASNTTGVFNSALGARTLEKNTTGQSNSAFGVTALFNNTTGSSNTAFGDSALLSNTTASNNTAVGYQAGYSNTTGTNGTFVGYQAGYNNTTTSYNTAVGDRALFTNSTGSGQVAMGEAALYSNTTGSSNTALGYQALQTNTTASNNTAVGYQAGYTNATGTRITAVGFVAAKGGAGSAPSYSVAVGSYALTAVTSGDSNTAVGDNSMGQTTTGSANTAVGQSSLNANTTGTNNTALGLSALYSNTTASGNTAVGYQAAYLTTTSDVTAIGNLALQNNTTGYNTAVGSYVLTANTTGSGNYGFGGIKQGAYTGALRSNTTGNDNAAFAGNALSSNTTGSSNSAFGVGALGNNTTASSNTAVGYQAAYSNTTGFNSVSVGYQALQSTTTGNYSTAIGMQAIKNNVTGSQITALGYQAGLGATADYGTFIGSQSGASSTGTLNTFVGWAAGFSMTSGAKNTIIGGFQGNQGNLDIRTASNYAVISDGDGNPFLVHRKDYGLTIANRSQIASAWEAIQNKSQINMYEGTNGNFEIASGYSTSDFVVGTGGTTGNVAYSANGGSYLSVASGIMAIIGSTFTIGSNTYTVTSESSEGFVYCSPDASGEAASGTLVGLKYATEGFRVYDNRTAQFKSTVGVGGTAGSTSGAGITFPATQSASSNANTLDDYEEGSFTPELSFGNGTTGITYNARNGTYVKIGRLVFVRFGMYLTSKGSSTGTARVSGLPFTSYSESYSDPSIVFNGGGFTGLTAGLTGIFLNGDTRIEIRANTTTGTALMDNTYFNNTTEFYGSACYYATA